MEKCFVSQILNTLSLKDLTIVSYPDGKLVQPADIFLSLYSQALKTDENQISLPCSLLAWIWGHAKITIPSGFFDFIITVASQPFQLVPPEYDFTDPAQTYDKDFINDCISRAFPIGYYEEEDEIRRITQRRNTMLATVTSSTTLWNKSQCKGRLRYKQFQLTRLFI